MSRTDNTNIFTGFSDIYDKSRPETPVSFIFHIKRYLERKADTLVDIGCGTGLSIEPWLTHAKKIIGVEPNEDMLRVAKNKYDSAEKISFLQKSGENTGLPSESADVVTCVQAFHWLEAETALPELARILKTGGVLAALDNDFPPVSFWAADRAYEMLLDMEQDMENQYPQLREGHFKADKSKHLQKMKDSGLFSYCREIVFSDTELYDAQGYIDLAYSQSPLQRILKAGIPEMDPYLNGFERDVREAFGKEKKEIAFCYRLRIAVK